jgi:probable phosphoglycerate mutase
MIVGLVRHGRTAWNLAGRMQGRADVPLSPAGREQVAAWRLPSALAHAHIVASPLVRARETARLLAGAEPEVEADLIEMDWGRWEGETFASLRATLGADYAAVEALGIDFRPPGGESPRDVQGRVLGWFERIATQPGPVLAVTHKGVLRAVLAAVTGWTMLGKAPVRLADDSVHLLEVMPAGVVRPVAWNVPLRGLPAAPASR